MFTVVDLLQSQQATANGINRDGWVAVSAAGFEAFVFVPHQPNDPAGTTQHLAPPFGISAQALGINNRVDVVGWTGVQIPQGAFRQAALWKNCGLGGGSGFLLKTLTQFFGVSLGDARATGINDSRLVVGWSDTTIGGIHRAVLWDGDHPTDPPVALESLDSNLPSEANGVNDQGQIVGRSQARTDSGEVVDHAVVWDSSTLKIVRDLGTFASLIPTISKDLHTHAMAVNDSNTIVGVGDMANPPVRPRAGFIAQAGGSMKLIPMIPATNAGAWAVAPNGTVALTISVPTSTGLADHGATFTEQQGLFDIDSTPNGASSSGHGLSGGWVMSEAKGINNAGQICGRGSTLFTADHALLLVP